MFDALGSGAVIDQAPQQHPELRDLTVGEAVTAMVLQGLGCMHQALSLVPRFFQHTPTDRLLAPRMAPAQRNDDALGRALDTLYAEGVTDLYRLMAATAAERRGLAPRLTPLDRTSVHVDGRSNSGEAPEAQVVHLTRGDSREHRPDFNHVMLELSVEQQAGSPLLMTPLRGHSREAQHVGEVVRTQVQPWQTT
jgi:transposase